MKRYIERGRDKIYTYIYIYIERKREREVKGIER